LLRDQDSIALRLDAGNASGRERTEAEYQSLLFPAEFSVRSIGQEAAKVILVVSAIGNEATN
jgi:hypothetical protein